MFLLSQMQTILLIGLSPVSFVSSLCFLFQAFSYFAVEYRSSVCLYFLLKFFLLVKSVHYYHIMSSILLRLSFLTASPDVFIIDCYVISFFSTLLLQSAAMHIFPFVCSIISVNKSPYFSLLCTVLCSC